MGTSGWRVRGPFGADSIDTTVDLPSVAWPRSRYRHGVGVGDRVAREHGDRRRGGGHNDPVAGNDSATDTDTVVVSSDLSVTQGRWGGHGDSGNAVVYTITVTNAGPSNATSVRVTDMFRRL